MIYNYVKNFYIQHFFFSICFVLHVNGKVVILHNSLFMLKQKYVSNVLLLTAFCLIITLFRWPLITENKHIHVTWPATVKCDPQLSNLQHAVGHSKDKDFKKKFLNFIIVRMENLFVEQLMQFCFAKLWFQRDTLRYFLYWSWTV